MKALRLVLPVGLFFTACIAGGSEFRVEGGALQLTGILQAEKAVIGSDGALSGDGVILGNLQIAGTVAPGLNNAGTQTVLGAIAFDSGSHFACDVASDTSLDRLNATGAVTGAATVDIDAAPGAIPVGQVIISGAPTSDYAGFFPSDGYMWRLESTGSLALALTDLRGDTDADGLPDWWEMRYFANSRTNATPAGDGDVDHVDNASEYVANTDPTNASDYLRFTACRPAAAGTSVMSWSTADGRRYSLLRTTNALSSGIATVAVVSVYSIPECAWTNAYETAGAALYRLTVEENAP